MRSDMHRTVMQACELKAKELGLPFEVVSPQTFCKPKQVKVNRRLWDAIVLIPGATVWVEVKIPPDDFTEGQEEFRRELLAFDNIAIKVKNVAEFEEDILVCLYERHLTLANVQSCQERIRDNAP